MTLSCARARELLWPLNRPRGHVPEEEEAKAHVAGCDACRAFFQRDAELDRLLARQRLAAQAPAELRERLFDALARERTSRPVTVSPARPRRRPGWAAAAAIAVLAAGLVFLRGGPDRIEGGRKFANDYVRATMDDMEVASLDSATIARFYMQELGHSVVPVRLAGAPMVKASVCLVNGERGSMIEYDLGGSRLAHYRIPADASGDGADRTDPVFSSELGLQVVRWFDGEFENALVSDVSGDRLAGLLDAFRGPASAPR
ncbi:MAG: hypothetical protein ACE5HF_06850 [Gemmatimonadota bacterium]